MGTMLRAVCECGFSKNFLAGGGFANFQTFCGAPALCPKCYEFHLLNYLDGSTSQLCTKCNTLVVFYNDPSLQSKPKKKIEGTIFSWHTDKGDFILPKVSFKCPQCKSMSLNFVNTGNWD